MSPRRMDIPSLLSPLPAPQIDRQRPPPASLRSILNHPPLGLDALVHAASERPRISPHNVPPCPAPDPPSPRYPNSYRMAGGIQVLSSPPPSVFQRHLPPSADAPMTTGVAPDRRPNRVWEEQPPARTVSPTRIPGVPECPAWSAVTETRLRIADHPSRILTPSLPVPACNLQSHDQPLPPQPLSSSPIHHRLPLHSEPQACLPQTPLLTSPRAPASPVLDLHLQDFETQSGPQPECSDAQLGASTVIPHPSSVPIVPEPAPGMARVVDPGASLLLPRQPSPELVQPVPALESVTCRMSTGVTVSHTTPSHPTFSSAKSERNLPPDGISISPLVQHELPSHRPPELECPAGRELSQQAMMDVDEELLSLVEDRSVHAAPEMPEPRIDSSSPLPVTVTGAGAEQGSGAASDTSSSVPPSQPVLKGPLLAKDEAKDRASMPPPAARNKKAEKDKTTLASGTGTGSKRKKDGTSRPAAKPKQPPKPRAKPVPKPKVKPCVVDAASKAGVARGTVNVNVNVNVRSRSTSVIPSTADDVVPEPEEHDSEKEDDKLYCVCKTRYDEDRMMIACDRCDEWFHTLCVNMPDQEIDLVDQFICSPCIQKHPQLRTTWKQRCLFGLQHEDPSSTNACHKPARGVFSKYCSDDCGIKYMQARIAQWEKSGGNRDLLWESVKNATKREGVVVCAVTNGVDPVIVDVDSSDLEHKPRDSAPKRRAEREVARLNARLQEVVQARELMKRELDMVMWREKVVELASERAGKADECGWDQRLCFGEEEWADFGSEVLESYEEERVKVESGDDTVPLDTVSATHEEWWCTGKKKCERHAGWQKLRAAEVSFDKETKEGTLLKLTASEREIRKCIEDILYPQPVGTLHAPPYPEVQHNGKPLSTGHVHVSEREKKTSA